MTSLINYKETLFKRANLNPICGKPTFKMIHKLQNKIKANTKSVYSNIGVGAHGYLSLVPIDAQCALISPTPFVYLTHLGTIIIPDGTTAHANSNTRIARTEKVSLFREVTGLEQALMQQIFAMVEEAYLAYIRNRIKNSINNAMLEVPTQLQDSYEKLMPHELLECKAIVKKRNCYIW